MPIPDLSNKPGPGRPGWGPIGSYDFQFRVEGTEAVVIKANAAGAGDFRISWPNGTTQVLSGNNASITAPDATDGIVSINNEELDTTYMDEFAVIGGKSVVREVISWGLNPWNNLVAAFDACTNLIGISETSLKTDSTGNLQAAFRDCTSLNEAVCKTWNLSAGALIADIFEGCTNLTKLDFTGVNIKISSSSARAFKSVGSATTDGCEFLFSGLNLSTSTYTGNQNFGWFQYTKIKPTSTFANWSFNPSVSLVDFSYPFESATITGTNSTLDISGWSSYSGTSMSQWFQNFNAISIGNTGAKINLTNLNTTNVTSMYFFGWQSGVTELIGLSTLGANTGNTGTIQMERAFSSMVFLKLSGSSNFGNTFTSSIKPSTLKSTFNQLGLSRTSDFSEAPILSNLDASQCATFQNMFQSSKLSTTPAFDTVTFPTTAVSFSATFNGLTVAPYSNSHLDFSNVTMKPSTLSSTFSALKVQKLTLGNNVDLSGCTVFTSAFFNGGSTSEPLEVILPTLADYSSATGFTTTFQGLDGPSTGNPPLTTCVADTLIRRLVATKLNGAFTLNLETTKITEAPAIVQSQLEQLRTAGWNITDNSTDATLPFAYPEYMVDPSSTTSLTPSTLPPVADRNFSSTNAGVTVNQNTGVLSWASNFEGFTTVRCTYADGCYNEVNIGIQVPFTMRRLIPAAGQTAQVGTRGYQYIDWGDGVAETNSGSASHTYSAAGTGFGTWRTIKIFDKSATEKFTGMQAYGNYYDRVNIIKWGSPVFSYLRFTGVYALGIRTAANDPLNTTSLTSFQSMFPSDSSYKTNARLIDPYNNLDTWKTSTATGGGAITTFESMFSGTSSLGQQCVNDESNFTFSFPAGTTATAGTYGNPSNQAGNINGVTQSGTTITGTIKFQIIVDGSGTVTLDNTNTHIIPQYMWQGDNVSVGDVIRIDAGSFGSLNNNITCTLTSDNVLASNGVCNLNGWDTSQVSSFYGMFNHNSGRTGGRRVQNVNFNNWNLSSAEDFALFSGLGNAANLKGTDLMPKNVSAADSPTGSAYIAWDTSNVTNFNQFGFIGDNHLGILRYWRFNTTNTFNMGSMFMNLAALQTYASDEPCKTQIIPANDPNNPFGVAYTAWNMEKCSNVGQMAYKQSGSPTGMISMAPALSSWQISDSLTSFHNFSRAYAGSFTFTPTVGQWDPSGLTGNQYWHSTRSSQPWKFSTSAYDNLLDITNGWGAHASTVNSGVTLNMGTSQYTAGGAAEQGRTALVNAGWTITDGGAIYSNTNALSFNGSTEYVDTGTTPDALVGSSNAYTVSAYVYPQGNGQFNKYEMDIIGAEDYWSNGRRFQFFLHSASGSSSTLSPGFRYGSATGGNIYDLTSNPTIPKNQWTHIAFTFDGNTTHKIYINGGSPFVTQTNGSAQTISSTHDLYIGARNANGSTSTWYTGRIDEVMVWNTELAQGEIQAYANAVGSGSIPDPNAITGLQLWNRMGD